MIIIMFTLKYQVRAPPLLPALRQLVVSAELLVGLTDRLPPYSLGICGPTVRLSTAGPGGTFPEPVQGVHRHWVEPLYNLQSSYIPINQSTSFHEPDPHSLRRASTWPGSLSSPFHSFAQLRNILVPSP